MVQRCLYSHRQRYSSSQCCGAEEEFISERNQNHDIKKEQALSINFSQYDWFILQNEHSWLAIEFRDKLTRAWREQRCLDSYRQRQISQPDCEITSSCGKKSSFPCLLPFYNSVSPNRCVIVPCKITITLKQNYAQYYQNYDDVLGCLSTVIGHPIFCL